ncbi:MAG: hypothetical protein JSU59_07295 [Nitrospirota bacterium]|nr:MAG: hypothetical protein JSU59_07295 [Nitrospirota bacterium]
MSCALPAQCWNPPTLGYWLLALTLLAALATGMARKSSVSPSLPDQNSYRSSQSDMAIESSNWRSEATDYESWREPPPPASSNWRSKSSRPSTRGSNKRQTEYFPEYKPGDPAFYNPHTGEQEDQIKVFEFGR